MSEPTEHAGEGAWSKLRHRKVVQWGLGYVAVAWGMLQGLGYVGNAFHWPEQLQRIAILGFVIGLPIVLVIAWYHGDRGQQRVSKVEFATLAALLVIGGGFLWWFGVTGDAWNAADVDRRTHAESVPDMSVAVLPLIPLATDPESLQFADGLTEELITLLARIPELTVTSRTSSFAFKGKDADVQTIANALKVAHVLEGSVQRSGDQLRVVVRLIDARKDRQLWSNSYDRPLRDVFSIQNEIASAVVGAMQLRLLGPLPSAAATRADAFALYLKAKDLARGRSPDGLRQAEQLLQQVLKIDPAFAPAWNRLSIVYSDQADRGLVSWSEGYARARAAEEKAIQADPRYASSYSGLGWIAMTYDRNFPDAARHLQMALDLEPNNPSALSDSAALLKTLGRLDEAIAIEEFNVARDPLSAGKHNNLAASYYYAGRLKDAEREFKRVLEISPKYSQAHMRLGMVLLAQGETEQALEVIGREVDEAARLFGQAVAYHDLRDRRKSDDALLALESRYPTEVESIAQAHAHRGEIDKAFDALERAYGGGAFHVRDLRVDPRWAPLKSDRRWQKLLETAGLSDERLAAIQLNVRLVR